MIKMCLFFFFHSAGNLRLGQTFLNVSVHSSDPPPPTPPPSLPKLHLTGNKEQLF